MYWIIIKNFIMLTNQCKRQIYNYKNYYMININKYKL